MAYTETTTLQGERWDSVAARMYGDGLLQDIILNANLDVPRYDVLPAGTVLKIPILDGQPNNTKSDVLPPWKQ